MSRIVVRHGSRAALLHRQSGLRAVERLNLAVLVDRQDDSVGGRIDVEPDDVAQFVDEARVFGQLERGRPMQLQSVSAPNALNRTDAELRRLRHRGSGPMWRFSGRLPERQSDDAPGRPRAQRFDARGPRLAARQPVEPFVEKAFPPPRHAGLGLAGSSHDRVRADAIGGQQHDLGPPKLLLGRIAVLNQDLEPTNISQRSGEGFSRARCADSYIARSPGLPLGTRMSGSIHQVPMRARRQRGQMPPPVRRRRPRHRSNRPLRRIYNRSCATLAPAARGAENNSPRPRTLCKTLQRPAELSRRLLKRYR